MNICLFTSTFLPKTGGLENVVDTLAKTFIRLGHNVVVLAKTPRGMKEAPKFDYPVYYYKRSRSEVWFLGSPKRELLRLHKQYKFDIIHAHQIYPTGWLAVKFSQKYGIPAVLTSHVGDVHDGSRYRRHWLISRRMIWAMRHAGAVTGVGSGICETIDSLLPSPKALYIENGCEGIGNPIPSAALQQKLQELGLDRGFDLTVCRLHRNKGLNYLVDAYALMKQRNFNAPPLIMAGSGQEEEALKQQITGLGLSDKIHLIGKVDKNDRNFLLTRCRFFLQPSVLEGMPLTILESLAAGCPVIATRIPGIAEVLRDGWNGRLVNPASPEEIADLYPQLTDEKRSEYAGHALEILKTQSWERIAQKYLALFEKLISKQEADK